jgi:ribulose bisphosphate carboxylase small subunit
MENIINPVKTFTKEEVKQICKDVSKCSANFPEDFLKLNRSIDEIKFSFFFNTIIRKYEI